MKKLSSLTLWKIAALLCGWICLEFLLSVQGLAQSCSLKGIIADAITGERLLGATVVIQDAQRGVITDENGEFTFNSLASGRYTLTISYVSYETQNHRAEVKSGQTLELLVKLEPISVELDAVQVSAKKRSDTEMSMISNIRNGNVVANGISKQQISRSQDKDASEVISRIPGVSVRDGKFINVRGLDERYNTVWLNGIGAPSSEADRRAFSFDMLPSSLIDNILLFKTPAPEIPADFAGAVVQIQTKSTVEQSNTDISYSTGYRQYTSFKNFYTYTGGKTDGLGFDDGTRALPKGFPSAIEFRELADNPSESEKQRITDLGKAFGKTWSPRYSRALPDQAVTITNTHKINAGKISLGYITSLGYSFANQHREIFRAGYQAYDEVNDHPDTSYVFYDDHYSTRTKLNGLCNWLVGYKNHRIEFRNFFNQISDKTVVLRKGRDFYGGSYKNASELGFQSRTIYSGQIQGSSSFNSLQSNLNYILGFGYTNKYQPDTRRIEKSRNEDSGPNAPYTISLNFNADPKLLGRLTLRNDEHIWVGGLNFSHHFKGQRFQPEIKTGLFFECKDRRFIARNIGYAISNVMMFDWGLTYLPIDSLFQNQNINFTEGIKVDESTNLSDSYNARNRLYAAYLGLNIPLPRIKVYAGFRIEKNIQTLHGHNETGIKVTVDNNFVDIFPSLNIVYQHSDKSLTRLAYGRTVNRPEFREIAPYTYYNFEEKATYYGNPELNNCYIHNTEVRFEYFPSVGDMITLGGFVKQFDNPIEAHLIESGTGLNYNYSNAIRATSYGLEIDLRKSLKGFENHSGISRYLKDFVIVFNAAIIRSQLSTDDPNAKDSHRPMQGQSPYLINTGLFYDNSNVGLMICALYNVIGEKIAFVGNNYNPHIMQLPRHLIDFTFHKKLGKYLTLKGGIKDLFNQPIELSQNEYVQLVPPNSENKVKRTQQTQRFKPNSSFILGLSLNF